MRRICLYEQNDRSIFIEFDDSALNKSFLHFQVLFEGEIPLCVNLSQTMCLHKGRPDTYINAKVRNSNLA